VTGLILRHRPWWMPPWLYWKAEARYWRAMYEEMLDAYAELAR